MQKQRCAPLSQLDNNCAADQRLCFLLQILVTCLSKPKFQIYFAVHLGLCQTWFKTLFSHDRALLRVGMTPVSGFEGGGEGVQTQHNNIE